MLWGKEVLSFVSCIVGSWGAGGLCRVPSPVEPSAYGMSWFWMRRRGRSVIPTLKLGAQQHLFLEMGQLLEMVLYVIL